MNFTSEWLAKHMERAKRGFTGPKPEQNNRKYADEGPEARLQSKIVAWAREWGHPCLSLRQSRNAKGFLLPGWPDVTLILHGRVLFLELKSKSGRMTEEQKMMRLQLLNHKQEVYEVRSYKRFLEIIEKPPAAQEAGKD